MAEERVKLHTDFQLNKCGKRSFVRNDDDDDDDRISQLPDDILIHIISFLSLKEAARTSVLASRWINLWKHTPSLKFEADESFPDNFYYHHKFLKREKRKYVKWVNSVIQSHESLTSKEFKIRFPLSKPARKAITRWLKFAFSRQVERLELDTKNYYNPSKHYCLPDEFLTRKSSCRAVVGFKSLKALVFKCVRVSDRAIEFFLHNCPLLEQLTVHQSEKMSKLEVCDSSLKLKHLEIVGCWRLKSLKVSAPCLTTLKFSSLKGLVLEDVPGLVNVSVSCCDDSISIKHLLYVVLPRCTCQLQTLRLKMYNMEIGRKRDDELCELPEMPNLKKLEIEYVARGNENLVRLAALMRVSPYLEEFALQMKWSTFPRIDREAKAAIIRSPHHHLKVFEFCGYYGSTNDVELLSYVLENRVVLEKVIIGTYCLYYPEVEQSAREIANEKLPPQVPQPVELVIL